MKSLIKLGGFCSICTAACLMTAAAALGQDDNELIGVWLGQGWVNTVELLLRSDGQYEAKSTTVGSPFGPSVDRGRYEIVGQ